MRSPGLELQVPGLALGGLPAAPSSPASTQPPSPPPPQRKRRIVAAGREAAKRQRAAPATLVGCVVKVVGGRFGGAIGTVTRSGHGFYAVLLPGGTEAMKRAGELVLVGEAGGALPVPRKDRDAAVPERKRRRPSKKKEEAAAARESHVAPPPVAASGLVVAEAPPAANETAKMEVAATALLDMLSQPVPGEASDDAWPAGVLAAETSADEAAAAAAAAAAL